MKLKTLKSAVFLTSISGQQITSYDVTHMDSMIVSCKNNGGDVTRYVTGIIQTFLFFLGLHKHLSSPSNDK